MHDYLSDLMYKIYFSANLKHIYYYIELHPDDRHYFAFYLPSIGQLQLTRIMQGSQSSTFTMNELINIMFGPIPAPNPEPSLLHRDTVALEEPNANSQTLPSMIYY